MHEIHDTPVATATGYTGPERRSTGAPTARWLARMLDEADHGMLLVTPSGRLRHANEAARRELATGSRLRLEAQTLHPTQKGQQAMLQIALAEAALGRRRLITLGGQANDCLPVAVVPLVDTGMEAAELPGETLVLMLLGKQQPCEVLTLDFFARDQGLTGAEARVLRALCGGLRPKEVARQFDVAVSTVRSQIGSIRAKTQTASIRDLVHRVTSLPPMSPALSAA
jgi:DNA-binding CsgD family transcriptional regulator